MPPDQIREPFNLSRGQKVLLGFGMAVLAAAVGAMIFSRHIPTPTGSLVAFACTLAAVIVMAGEGRRGGLLNLNHAATQAHYASNWFASRVWLRVPFMVLVCAGLTFSAVQDGVLALVTTATGKPASLTYTIRGTQRAKACRAFVLDGVGLHPRNALCANRELIDRARPGDRLILHGVGSKFGLNVERMELRPS